MNSLITKTIKEKFENSSIHAIPNIVRNKYLILKLSWVISFVLSTVICSFSIIKTISEYLNFPVITNILELNENPILFPIISICKTNFIEDELLNEIDFQTLATENNVSFTSKPFDNNIRYEDMVYFKMNFTFLQYVAMNNLAVLRSKFNSKNRTINLIQDILISCVFNFMPCKVGDFDNYYDIKYGHCLRFNNKDIMKSSTQRGSREGLQLELWVDPSIHNKNKFLHESGIKLFISNTTVDSNYEEGIKITGGFSFDLKLNKYSIIKLPKPYSDCDGDLKKPDDHESIYFKQSILNYKRYNYQLCYLICMQEYLFKNCQCESHVLPKFNLSNPDCQTPDKNICGLKYYTKYLENNLFKNCLCPLECEKNGYSYEMSFSDFPTESYSNYLAKSMLIKSKYPLNETISYDKLKKNVVSVNIYYDEFKHKTIFQEAKLGIIDLISNIGGTLGLFLGKALNFIIMK
jgi:hypothetical protein